jgi:hypothetical protein
MSRITQLAATLTAAALFSGSTAMAATLYIGPATGTVQTAGNWDNGLPSSTNPGTISSDALYVTGTAGLMTGYHMTLTAGTLKGASAAVFNLSGGSMTVNGASAEFSYSGMTLTSSSYTVTSGKGTANTGANARATNLGGSATATFDGGTSTFEREIVLSGFSQFIVNAGTVTVNTNSATAANSGFRTGTDGGTLRFNGGTTVAPYLNMAHPTGVVFGGTAAGSLALTEANGNGLALDPANLPNVTLNWLSGSQMSLTVAGRNQAYYETLWGSSRLQFNGGNTGAFGDHFVVSGETLTLIPEPASLSLLGLGGLLMLGRRRLA